MLCAIQYTVEKIGSFFLHRNSATKAEARLRSNLSSTFVGGGRIIPDEERLVLLKPVVHLSFTYGVLRGLEYDFLTFIISLFIYCSNNNDN